MLIKAQIPRVDPFSLNFLRSKFSMRWERERLQVVYKGAFSSQRAIEQAVDKAVADGAIAGLKLNVKFDGEIKLQQAPSLRDKIEIALEGER